VRGINGKWKLARGAADPMGEGLEKGRRHANEPNHLKGCNPNTYQLRSCTWALLCQWWQTQVIHC